MIEIRKLCGFLAVAILAATGITACARAQPDLDKLYDVSVRLITEDHPRTTGSVIVFDRDNLDALPEPLATKLRRRASTAFESARIRTPRGRRESARALGQPGRRSRGPAEYGTSPAGGAAGGIRTTADTALGLSVRSGMWVGQERPADVDRGYLGRRRPTDRSTLAVVARGGGRRQGVTMTSRADIAIELLEAVGLLALAVALWRWNVRIARVVRWAPWRTPKQDEIAACASYLRVFSVLILVPLGVWAALWVASFFLE